MHTHTLPSFPEVLTLFLFQTSVSVVTMCKCLIRRQVCCYCKSVIDTAYNECPIARARPDTKASHRICPNSPSMDTKIICTRGRCQQREEAQAWAVEENLGEECGQEQVSTIKGNVEHIAKRSLTSMRSMLLLPDEHMARRSLTSMKSRLLRPDRRRSSVDTGDRAKFEDELLGIPYEATITHLTSARASVIPTATSSGTTSWLHGPDARSGSRMLVATSFKAAMACESPVPPPSSDSTSWIHVPNGIEVPEDPPSTPPPEIPIRSPKRLPLAVLYEEENASRDTLWPRALFPRTSPLLDSLPEFDLPPRVSSLDSPSSRHSDLSSVWSQESLPRGQQAGDVKVRQVESQQVLARTFPRPATV